LFSIIFTSFRALLEKIKYDLVIARTDNQVDMRYLCYCIYLVFFHKNCFLLTFIFCTRENGFRYMINMDYSADLPINTLGRRVRTRLYFTSESHLHTLVNVLRFAYDEENSKNSPLSKFGRAVIANAPELCYLTQIVFRLFEDRNKDPTDPKRYRVEILFSPGAASPPRHTSDVDPENDSSRFDTEEVEVISKESLTCQELEDYLDESIKAGFTVDEDISISSSAHGMKKDKNNKKRKGTSEIIPEVFVKNSSSLSGAKSQQMNTASTCVTPSNEIKQPSDSDALISAPELSSQLTVEGDLSTNVSHVGPAEIGVELL
jgi:hypothetical protein